MHAPVILALADLEGFFFGSNGLLGGDEPVVLHALDDVELPGARPLRVADRVVGRRCLGQAGQHGGFGNADILERLAEIGFRSGGKTIRPVAQKNLVHVDLKDLVLGQQMLELEGQQDLVNLAGVAFFG